MKCAIILLAASQLLLNGRFIFSINVLQHSNNNLNSRRNKTKN